MTEDNPHQLTHEMVLAIMDSIGPGARPIPGYLHSDIHSALRGAGPGDTIEIIDTPVDPNKPIGVQRLE